MNTSISRNTLILVEILILIPALVEILIRLVLILILLILILPLQVVPIMPNMPSNLKYDMKHAIASSKQQDKHMHKSIEHLFHCILTVVYSEFDNDTYNIDISNHFNTDFPIYKVGAFSWW